MSTQERWDEAHEAEKEHETHQGEIPSKQQLEHILNNHNLALDEFDNRTVLAVGGGTGIIHRIDNSSISVSIDPITEYVIDDKYEVDSQPITGVGEKLPFSQNSFDWVICRNVLDHTKSPEGVLDEIKRVLKPSGNF